MTKSQYSRRDDMQRYIIVRAVVDINDMNHRYQCHETLTDR